MIQVSIEVNGKTVTAEVEPRLTLLDFIRDVAGLKGTHAGCEHGVCGACTVLVEGNAIRSCLVLAVQADEQEVISIEGVGGDLGRSGELSIVQDAFCEAHGLQCGYCTPGMVLGPRRYLLTRRIQPRVIYARPFQATFAVALAMCRLSKQ